MMFFQVKRNAGKVYMKSLSRFKSTKYEFFSSEQFTGSYSLFFCFTGIRNTSLSIFLLRKKLILMLIKMRNGKSWSFFQLLFTFYYSVA